MTWLFKMLSRFTFQKLEFIIAALGSTDDRSPGFSLLNISK